MREAFNNSNHNNIYNPNSNHHNFQLQQQNQMQQMNASQAKQSAKKQQQLFMAGHKAAFTTDQSPQLLLKSEALNKLGPSGAHSQSNHPLHASHLPQSSASSYFLSDPVSSSMQLNPPQLTPQQIEALQNLQFQQMQLQHLSSQREKPENAILNLGEMSSQAAVAEILAAQQNSRQQVQQYSQAHHQKNNSMGNQYSGQLSYYCQPQNSNQATMLSFDEKIQKDKLRDMSMKNNNQYLQNNQSLFNNNNLMSSANTGTSSQSQPPIQGTTSNMKQINNGNSNLTGYQLQQQQPSAALNLSDNNKMGLNYSGVGLKAGAANGHKKSNSMMNSKMASILLKNANSHIAAAYPNSHLNPNLINNFMPNQISTINVESATNKSSLGQGTANNLFLTQFQQQQQEQLSFQLYGQSQQFDQQQQQPSLFQVQQYLQPQQFYQPNSQVGSIVNSSHQTSVHQANSQNIKQDPRQFEQVLTPLSAHKVDSSHMISSHTKPISNTGQAQFVELKPQAKSKQASGQANLTGAKPSHKKMQSMHLQQTNQMSLLQNQFSLVDSRVAQQQTSMSLQPQQQQQQLQILQKLQNQQQSYQQAVSLEESKYQQVLKKQQAATSKVKGGSSQAQSKSGGAQAASQKGQHAQQQSSSSHHRTKSDTYNNRGSIVLSSKQQLQVQQSHPQKRLTQHIEPSSASGNISASHSKTKGSGAKFEAKALVEAHQLVNSRQIVNPHQLNKNGLGIATTGQAANFILPQGSIDFSEAGGDKHLLGHTQIDQREKGVSLQSKTAKKGQTVIYDCNRDISNKRNQHAQQILSGQISSKQSVHHSKKSSYTNAESLMPNTIGTPNQAAKFPNQNQMFSMNPTDFIAAQQLTQLKKSQTHSKKKSTKDKYNELKVLYDDLLEKHQATQMLLQHQALIMSQSKESVLPQSQVQSQPQSINSTALGMGTLYPQNQQPGQQILIKDFEGVYQDIAQSPHQLVSNKVGGMSSLSLDYNQSHIPANTPRLIAQTNLGSNQNLSGPGVMSQQVSHSNLASSISKQPQVNLNLKSLKEQPQIFPFNLPQSQDTLSQNDQDEKKQTEKPKLNSIVSIPAKVMKQAVGKLEEGKASQIQLKTASKMNLASGQTRKNASAQHKRSVSDGNEQLFKFKQQQQAMQRYLYPQPSNHTLNVIDNQTQLDAKQEAAAPQNSEETITSSRVNNASIKVVSHPQAQILQNSQALPQNIVPTPFLQPAHHRRVSDDFISKQKKFLALQQEQQKLRQNQNMRQSQPLRQKDQYDDQMLKNQTLSQNYLENVSSEHPSELGHQLNTADLSVKNFLFEMRNKTAQAKSSSVYPSQHQMASNQTSNNNTDFISIVDELPEGSFTPYQLSNQQIASNLSPTGLQKISGMQLEKRSQFAMIIEENSPLNKQSSRDIHHSKSNLSDFIAQEVNGQIVLQPNFYQRSREDSTEAIVSANKLPSGLQLQTKNSEKDLSQESLRAEVIAANGINQISHAYDGMRGLKQQNNPLSQDQSLASSSRDKAVGKTAKKSMQGIGASLGEKPTKKSMLVKGTQKETSVTVPTQGSNEKKSNQRRLLDNKRSSSPIIDQARKGESLVTQKATSGHHKRVKSDVPPEQALDAPQFKAHKKQPSAVLGSSKLSKQAYLQNKINSTIETDLKARPTINGMSINMFNINSDKSTPKRTPKPYKGTPQASTQQSKPKQLVQNTQNSCYQRLEKQKGGLPFGFGLGSDMLYAQQQDLSSQLDGSGDKKVVNVSIDLIPDEFSLDEGSHTQTPNLSHLHPMSPGDLEDENVNQVFFNIASAKANQNQSAPKFTNQQKSRKGSQARRISAGEGHANEEEAKEENISCLVEENESESVVGAELQNQERRNIEQIGVDRRASAKREASAHSSKKAQQKSNSLNQWQQKQSNNTAKKMEGGLQNAVLQPYTKKSSQLKASGRKPVAKSNAGINGMAFSGGSDIAAKQEKYKKMLSKYENTNENGQKSNRKYTFDQSQLAAIAPSSQSQFHPQLGNISNSISPSALAHINNSTISPKGRVSIPDKKVTDPSVAKRFQPLQPQYQINQKLFYPLSPKNQLQSQVNKAKPASKQNIVSSYAPQLNKPQGGNQSQVKQITFGQQNASSQADLIQKQHHQNQAQKGVSQLNQQVNQSIFGTLLQYSAQNNINPIRTDKEAAAPNNSAVQTSESPRSPMMPTAQIQFNQPMIVMKEALERSEDLSDVGLMESSGKRDILQNLVVNDRMDTQDSCLSETQIESMTPRSRASNKLVKSIKQSFRQGGQHPPTTVDFYRIGKVLGKGAFGKVNLALHKLSGKFAAIKSINKQYLSDESSTKKVMQEVVILKRTRHSNIVRLYEFFETQKHILFVMELCAGGDLLNYVRKRRRLKEDLAKSVFKQIIEGIGYCHSKSILHRDIKLDNILLDSEGEVKICDFGVSKIVKKGEIMTEQCGTPAYIAPEILRDKGYEGFAVDIWSAGVVLYAMLYGTVPFKANNMTELQKLIIKAQYTLKEDISLAARELLQGLLEKEPLKRMTVEQILSHEWLKDASEKVQLFSEQEKESIRSEFTYGQNDRLNRNTHNQIHNNNTNNTQTDQRLETDPFTDHMLDSTHNGNSLLRNHTTKSVILAPFNSTKSNLQEYDPATGSQREIPALTESMKQMLLTRKAIKYGAKCREANKQYEANNNAELDNGVYHKNEEEEEEQKRAGDTNQNDEMVVDDFGQMEKFTPEKKKVNTDHQTEGAEVNIQNFMNILQNETDPSPELEVIDMLEMPHLNTSQGDESKTELIIPESDQNSPSHPLTRPAIPSSRRQLYLQDQPQKDPINIEEDEDDSLQGSFNNQQSSLRSDEEEKEQLIDGGNQAEELQQIRQQINVGLINRHQILMNSCASEELSQTNNKQQSGLQKLESLIMQQELENRQEDIIDMSLESQNLPLKGHHPSFNHNQLYASKVSLASLNPYQDKQDDLQYQISQDSRIAQHRIVIDDRYIAGVVNSEVEESQIFIRDEQAQLKQARVDTSVDYSREEPSNLNLRGQSPRPGVNRQKASTVQFQNLLGTAQTLIVDEDVLQIVELMGYPREFIIKCLNNNELNYATTGYYLLHNKNCLSFCYPPVPKFKQLLQRQQQSAMQMNKKQEGLVSNEEYIKSMQKQISS